MNACICLLLAIYAQEPLHYWMGDKLGPVAPVVLVFVCYCLFLESLTDNPSLVNDGLGRPHITGIAALLRATLGLAGARWAQTNYGIVALHLTQLFVSAITCVGFVVLVHRWSLPWSWRSVPRRVYGPGGALLVAGSIAVFWRTGHSPITGAEFLGSAISLVVVLVSIGLFVVLSPEHRVRLVGVVSRRLGRA